MHPMAKILLLLVACQVLQTSYTLRRLHAAHSGWRRWAEVSPLMLATLALVYLTLRLFEIIPHLVVI